MYLDMLQSKAPPPVAFTVEERDRIIAAFVNDSRPGTDYRHYAPFVKFLFWTGCRPCEAIGLRWGSVLPDCSRVHFHESIVEISGRKVRRKTVAKRKRPPPPVLSGCPSPTGIRAITLRQSCVTWPSSRSGRWKPRFNTCGKNLI